jgi:hypothetical protein
MTYRRKYTWLSIQMQSLAELWESMVNKQVAYRGRSCRLVDGKTGICSSPSCHRRKLGPLISIHGKSFNQINGLKGKREDHMQGVRARAYKQRGFVSSRPAFQNSSGHMANKGKSWYQAAADYVFRLRYICSPKE